MRRLATDRGTAVLVVTHDTRMIGEVDRVIRLMDGEVVDQGPASAERGPGDSLAGRATGQLS